MYSREAGFQEGDRFAGTTSVEMYIKVLSGFLHLSFKVFHSETPA